jgi:RNA polymerase sigma factor (sigma-70 family)
LTDLDRIIREHIGLARSLAERSYLRDKHAAFSAAMQGLMDAAESWDGREGAFHSFAAVCIRNKLFDAYKKERGRKGVVFERKTRRDFYCASLEEMIPGTEFTIGSRQSDLNAMTPDALVATVEDSERVALLLSELPARDASIVRAYWIDDLNMDEIAERHGVTKQRVHQILSRAQAYLRAKWKSGALA